jgi:hypothetical protein
MKHKKLLKRLAKAKAKLADVTCHNDVLMKENERLAAEIEKMARHIHQRTLNYLRQIDTLRAEKRHLDAMLSDAQPLVSISGSNSR